uniref:Glutathione peroxidase n=1 Tax=Ixodes scapularis TaxID=6945 RepID=A0A4D5S6G2_IXOSC
MLTLTFAATLLVAGLAEANSDESWKNAKSIYEFRALDIDGNKVDFNKYRDHVTLIVNVTSKCTLTQEHYTKLSALYHKYSESKGLRIMAFPTNDFAKQEPWAELEIKEFVKKQFNVTFDMFS